MPRTFSTVRELIYWEYAKLISERAVGDRLNYKFANFTFRRLLEGKATPSSILGENQQLFTLGNVCAYCGATGTLHWEHIISVSLGGPDSIDNMVRACATCNLTKGARDPYQWYLGAKKGDSIPRLVLGKFLKVVFEEYSVHNLLDSTEFMKLHAIERVTLSSIFLNQASRKGKAQRAHRIAARDFRSHRDEKQKARPGFIGGHGLAAFAHPT